MKRKLDYLFLCCVSALSCCAAPAENVKGLPKLAPPPIVSQWKEERVKVMETGEFSSMTVPAGSKRKKASRNSAADLVAEKGKKFFWKPSPLLSSTIRTADLTGAALSADGSLAVVTERIGGEGKANSTRVLFFDIPERRLAGGFVLHEVLLSSIAFVPGSKSEIFAIRSSFAPYKVTNGIVRIGLQEKRILDSFDSPGNKAITSFVCSSKGKLFFSIADSPLFYEIEQDSFAVESLAIKSTLSSPRVCTAGELLIAYGKEGVQTFRRDHGRWIADEKLHVFPEKFQPASSSVIDAAVPAICFAGAYEEDLWYYRNGSFRKLKERISGIHLWEEKQKIFFAEVAANNRVAFFQMPEGSEHPKTAAPNRLKPANRNGSFAFLKVPALKEQMVQIDNRGNVFVLDYSRITRWKKYVVYIADRAGFR